MAGAVSTEHRNSVLNSTQDTLGNIAGASNEDDRTCVLLDKLEAEKSFKKALDGRRKTWIYDWMIPLFLSELDETHEGGLFSFRSHTSTHKLRAKLHELQRQMVPELFLHVFVKLHTSHFDLLSASLDTSQSNSKLDPQTKTRR
jgi:hypothetical protein